MTTPLGPPVTEPVPGDGDRIQLRGLRMVGTHGVLPEEKSRAQPFEIDLDLSVDLSLAAGSDRLADTVDYAAVATTAAAIVSGTTSFELLEALAAAVAEATLATDLRISRRHRAPQKAATTATRGRRHRRGPAVPPPVTVPVQRLTTYRFLYEQLESAQSYDASVVKQTRSGDAIRPNKAGQAIANMYEQLRNATERSGRQHYTTTRY